MDYYMRTRKTALLRNRVFGSGGGRVTERANTHFVEDMTVWLGGHDKQESAIDDLLAMSQEDLKVLVVRFKVEREE